MRAKDPDRAFLRAVGEAVRAAREKRELSQEELALRIQVDRTYISGVERGVRNPTVKMLRLIAEGLGVRASELVRQAERD